MLFQRLLDSCEVDRFVQMWTSVPWNEHETHLGDFRELWRKEERSFEQRLTAGKLNSGELCTNQPAVAPCGGASSDESLPGHSLLSLLCLRSLCFFLPIVCVTTGFDSNTRIDAGSACPPPYKPVFNTNKTPLVVHPTGQNVTRLWDPTLPHRSAAKCGIVRRHVKRHPLCHKALHVWQLCWLFIAATRDLERHQWKTSPEFFFLSLSIHCSLWPEQPPPQPCWFFIPIGDQGRVFSLVRLIYQLEVTITGVGRWLVCIEWHQHKRGGVLPHNVESIRSNKFPRSAPWIIFRHQEQLEI